jgi:hypothetical protein
MNISLESPKFCHRPWDVRFMNWLGPILKRLRLTPSKRSPQDLRDLACERLTAEQWGHESFREGLCVLIDTISKDFDLTYTGWRRLRGILISHLLNRVAIHHQLQHSPDILQQPVSRPLFVTGLPRTGSTTLQRLLATDPGNRCLIFWQACRPAPPPRPETRDSDPRIAEARRFIRWLHRLAPHYDSIHPMHPTHPEECTILLMNTFICGAFRLYGPTDRYANWYGSVDKGPAYRDYRRQLQLLQYHDPGKRWILKAPEHKNNLDFLLPVFPDACIVQTHRDPLKVVPSACSLLATMRGVMSDRLDLHRIGRNFVQSQPGMLARVDQVRETADTAQFFDVHFNELMQDPIGAVRRIYEYFDLPYTDVFECRMQKWLTENHRGKHGRHRYSLEQFGLEPGQVRERFADYCRRYGVEPDGAPSSSAKAA